MKKKINEKIFLKIKNNLELFENLKLINFNFKNLNYFDYLFDEYLKNYYFCENIPNIELCKQIFKGYKYYFIYKKNELFLTRTECNHTKSILEKNIIKNNYLIQDFDDSLLNLNFNNKFISKLNKNSNSNIKIILSEMINFLCGKRKKGLFIYGKPGVGKTNLLIRFANRLAFINKNLKISFISVINLVNNIKESFSYSDNSNNFFIKKILKSDFIFLDDIGGETVSNWVRDDLMFRILNDCLNKKKIVFFSSNFSLSDLFQIYSNCKNNNLNYKINIIKSQRLIDRIKELTSEFEFIGINYREKK